MGLGYVEGVTHDYRRHGTTTLFAALDTAKGKLLTQCRPRHRHQKYLGFPREIVQTCAGKTLVRSTAKIPRALHTDLCLVAGSSGDLVQPDYAAGHSSRDVSQRQGTGREN